MMIRKRKRNVQDSDVDMISKAESSRNMPLSTQTNSPKKKRCFSSDLLKLFVISEKDRSDFKIALDYLKAKYDTKNVLHSVFPLTKAEEKSSPCVIRDFFFKKLTESESKSSVVPPSESVDFGVSDRVAVHPQPLNSSTDSVEQVQEIFQHLHMMTVNKNTQASTIIRKEDISFQKLIETEFESKLSSAAPPESFPFGISDQAVVHHQPAAEQNLICNGFPQPTHAAETGTLFATFPIAPATLPTPSRTGLPVASHSVLPQQPQFPANFNTNLQPLNSSTSNVDLSLEKLQEIFQHLRMISDNSQAPVIDHNQRPFLQDPHFKRNMP